MRRVPALLGFACLALCAAALGAGDAAAANGELGGGLIELLLTGSTGPTQFAPAIPATACVAKLADSPNPELLMALINPETVFGEFVPVPTEIEVLAVVEVPSDPFTRYFTAIVVVPVVEFSVSFTVAFAVLLERLRNTLFSPLL